jgi:hypothetical protein
MNQKRECLPKLFLMNFISTSIEKPKTKARVFARVESRAVETIRGRERRNKKSSLAKIMPHFKCLSRANGREHPKPLQSAATQSVRRVPHRARLCQHSLGGDQPFPTAALDSSAAASAACGWQHQGQCGNQMTAQLKGKQCLPGITTPLNG